MTTAPTIPRRGERIATIALLILGLGLWWHLFGDHPDVFTSVGPWGPIGWWGIAAIVIVSLLPPARRSIAAIQRAARQRLASSRLTQTIAIGFLGGLYLAFTAYRQGRSFTPLMHDESSYLIGAKILARGSLWMPHHPLAEFFDSFQLIVDPVYASAYFPGTALLHVPGIWFHAPPWVTNLFLSSLAIALTYWIVAELIDELSGVSAAVLLLSAYCFREISIMTLSQMPVLVLSLAATVAFLKWRKTGSVKSAIAIGFFGGWAIITRPLDAACFGLPILIAMLLIRGKRKSLVFALVGALPFISIQLISNFGITGHFFETPFRYYADRDHPLTSFGFHPFDPSARPVSTLPQKKALYDEYRPLVAAHTVTHAINEWTGPRLRQVLSLGSITPFPLLVIFLPVSLLAMSRGRWVVIAVLPLFIVFYACYVFFFPHYAVVVAPALIVATLLGVNQIERMRWPGFPRVGHAIVVMLAIAALPEFDASARDEPFDVPLLSAVESSISKLPVNERAIVLFRFSASRNVHEEPVYNSALAWPDGAAVIRAHDLGSENVRLFRYYAQRQPNRVVYLFDEGNGAMTRLGNVRSLAGE